MPELPEVESVRRRLEPVMLGARFEQVRLRRPDLRGPFPERFSERLIGQAVLAVERRAKYLVVALSSDETLLMHLGMSGSFRVEPGPGGIEPSERHDHVIFQMSSGVTVIFNDPRRFGFMDLVVAGGLAQHPAIGALGPEPLSPAFDGFALARACRGRKTSLKVALLDQRVVSGLGNIYAAEALHLARLAPDRQASTIATATGLPRPTAHRLAAAIRQVLQRALKRRTEAGYRGSRFQVYQRAAVRCSRKGCGGLIARRTHAGRSTFYCPTCQR